MNLSIFYNYSFSVDGWSVFDMEAELRRQGMELAETSGASPGSLAPVWRLFSGLPGDAPFARSPTYPMRFAVPAMMRDEEIGCALIKCWFSSSVVLCTPAWSIAYIASPLITCTY